MKPDFLDEVEKQLVDAAQRGRLRRRLHLPRVLRRVPTLAAVGGISVAVAATAVAATAVLPSGTTAVTHHQKPMFRVAAARMTQHLPKHSPSTSALYSTSAAAGGPVPTHFEPQSFTAIGEFTWWLLGQAPCAHEPCTSIVRTTNGGVSFVGIPAPRTTKVDQLRFADALVGYAYGPQLWSTHDGGGHWIRVHVGGRVDSLATSGTYVYAVVGSGTHRRVMRSPVGLDDFKRLNITHGFPIGGLWVQANQVFVDVRGAAKHKSGQWLGVSTDSGFRFTSYRKLPSSKSCSPDAGLPNVWVQCSTGRLSGTWLSTDGAKHFRAAGGTVTRAKRKVRSSSAGELPSGTQFASASASTAVLGWAQLYRTANGGRTFHRVRTPRGVDYWKYLGFTDSTHGVALGVFAHGTRDRLYYTTNAGRSYHYVPINP